MCQLHFLQYSVANSNGIVIVYISWRELQRLKLDRHYPSSSVSRYADPWLLHPEFQVSMDSTDRLENAECHLRILAAYLEAQYFALASDFSCWMPYSWLPPFESSLRQQPEIHKSHEIKAKIDHLPNLATARASAVPICSEACGPGYLDYYSVASNCPSFLDLSLLVDWLKFEKYFTLTT